jgi:rhodanese-related sulfurtransferase
MRKLLICMSAAMALAAPPAFAAETGAAVQGDAAQQYPASAPAPAVAEYKYKTPQLKRGTIDALLAKPESILVIDVRRPDELTAIGGLPVYLSVQAKDLEKSLAFIPRDRIIVTVSNHAGRAGAAGDLLTSHGFNVAGAIGVQNYEAEGGALTKIAPPPPAPKTAEIEKR